MFKGIFARNCRKAVLFGAIAFVAGCSGPYPQASLNRPQPIPVALLPDADIVAVSYAAAEHLMGQVYEPLARNRPILVTSLANINDLDRSSTLGRLIAEQVGSRVSQLGYPVVEVKLRSTLAVNEQGEFALSRDIRNISAAHDAQAVIAGTYAAGNREIYISLRLIRMADAKIISSFDYSLPAGKNTRSLVQTVQAFW